MEAVDYQTRLRSILTASKQIIKTGRYTVTHIGNLQENMIEDVCKYLLIKLSFEQNNVYLCQRRDDLHYIVLNRTAEVERHCLVNTQEVERWKESNKDAVVMSLLVNQEGLHELSLLGFILKSSPQIFNKGMIMNADIAKQLDSGSTLSESQYVIEVSNLKQTISAPAVSAAVTQRTTNRKQRTSVEGFLVILDISNFVNEFGSSFQSSFIVGGSTCEMVMNRVNIYKVCMQAKNRLEKQEIKPELAFNIIKTQFDMRNLDSLEIQRFTTNILLWISAYNSSFKELMFCCEEFIYDLLCQQTQLSHKCERFAKYEGEPRCDIMSHTKHLYSMLEAMVLIKDDIEAMPVLTHARNMIERRIIELMGPLDKIFEKIQEQCNREYDYIY